MKRFTIPALVLALGCTLLAAPQGNGKGSGKPPASTTDKTKPKKEKKTKPKKEKKPKDASSAATKSKPK